MTPREEVIDALRVTVHHDCMYDWNEDEIADAVLEALGIPTDADLQPFHKMGRMDGESVDGEHTWNTCDSPDDWTTPEAWTEHDPEVYYIDSYLRIGHVERTFGTVIEEPEPILDHDTAMKHLGILRVVRDD